MVKAFAMGATILTLFLTNQNDFYNFNDLINGNPVFLMYCAVDWIIG